MTPVARQGAEVLPPDPPGLQPLTLLTYGPTLPKPLQDLRPLPAYLLYIFIHDKVSSMLGCFEFAKTLNSCLHLPRTGINRNP